MAGGSPSCPSENNAQIPVCTSEGLSHGEAPGIPGRVRAQLCHLQNKKCWRPSPQVMDQVCVSPHASSEIPTPAKVFAGGAFGRRWVSALKEETLRVPSLFPAEETARRQPAVNHEASPSQPSNLLATRSKTSGLQNCEK